MIHKNIKASNVLLDADLNPHLTDCGLAYFYEVCRMSLKEFVEQSMNVKNCDNQLSAGYECEPGTRVRSSRVHKVIRLRYEERCLLLWCRHASAIDRSEALRQVIN